MKPRHSRTFFLLWMLCLIVVSTIGTAACRATQAPAISDATNTAPIATNSANGKTPSSNNSVGSSVGFASRQKWLDHFEKHGHEFGSITAEEYLRQAQTLRDQPAGGNVLESVRRDGVITRFDKQSGAFLAFNEDLTIRTYFKPNDGANYFWRQSKR